MLEGECFGHSMESDSSRVEMSLATENSMKED
jgi:hypothetical protein